MIIGRSPFHPGFIDGEVPDGLCEKALPHCPRRSWNLEYRIERCRALDQSFIPRLFGDEVGKEVSSGFGTYLDGDVQEVVVRFSPEIRPFVERRTWHPSQKNTDLADGWLEVKFETTGLEALKYWLYRWIPHVKVVSPEALKEEMMQDLQAQLNNLPNRSD